MKRRTFLRNSLLGVAGLAVGGLASACANQTPTTLLQRETLMTDDLDEKTIAELQAAMQAGHLTAQTLVQSYLARIEATDRAGPHLRSVIELNPEALAIAEMLDAERADTGPRGRCTASLSW